MIYDQIEKGQDSRERSPNRQGPTFVEASHRGSAAIRRGLGVGIEETGNVYSRSTERARAFPWGVNSVVSTHSGSIRQTPSRPGSPKHQAPRRDIPLINENVAYARYEASRPVRECAFSADESIEYVDTSEISTGIGPLLDLLKSVFSFFTKGEDSRIETGSDQTDIETGLQLCEPSVVENKQVLSEFDRLHGAPVRFPSSIDELFTFESMPWKSYPVPEEDPPPIPPLPVPRLRNTSNSVTYFVRSRFCVFYVVHERGFAVSFAAAIASEQCGS